MGSPLDECYSTLLHEISQISDVVSIGKSGGNRLPEHGESDIDIFIFCGRIPDIDTRRAVIHKLGDKITGAKFSGQGGRFWGTIDFLSVEETEICLMYFTMSFMSAEIESVLRGDRLDKEAGMFYPTGRCATMISMHILYDKTGYIAGIKELLSVYPNVLAEKIIQRHIPKMNDREDFERAVPRADVLFYHATLENSIDHFLQVLFALNRYFLPSRKRTIQIINAFKITPENCGERLLQTIELGAKPETLSLSYDVWSLLCRELAGFIPYS